MCGIAGLINWGDSDILARMTDVQAHRGPDDRGVYETHAADGAYVGLGSRRLAILDLSAAGHMPMSNPPGTIWITYNGEIYNYPQLRVELEAKGYVFRSHSDTEAIIYLYQEYGAECVRRLNGMFAIAIWDVARQQMFLARDHFGVKPLYYIARQGRLAFASEVKALLQLPDRQAEVNLEALNQYMTFLWTPGPLTLFQDVYRLPPGHYAIWQSGQFTVESYWDLAYPPAGAEFSLSESELIEEVRGRFRQTVERQMLSDVPIGAFLSAGLDSSSIVAMMAQASGQPVKTFTITFPPQYRVGESTMDDPAVAARTARHFGCDHHEIVVEPQVADLLPNLLWHIDEPTADPALMMAYLVAREARREVTVLLSGVGGDELFAGYRKYEAAGWANTYRKIPAWARQHLIEPPVLKLPTLRGTPLAGPVRLAQKMVRSASLSPQDAFLMNSTYFDQAQRRQLYSPALGLEIEQHDSWIRHRAHFAQVSEADFLNQMMYVDIKTFMVSLNLTYNDKMTMASSVEGRVPFLDWELAEFVAQQVPPALKLRGHWRPTTKYLLRTAMRGILPEEVLHQTKAGFGAPIDYWLAHDLREMVDDLLCETRLRQRGYFEPATVQRLIHEQRLGLRNWSLQIWQLLTLELWHQIYIDGKPTAA
jgi:asparagine synthase (glutamine-hydrolysing)